MAVAGGVLLAVLSAAAGRAAGVESLGSRSGIVQIDDDNFGTTGRLSFRIDSIRAVPEPATLTLLTAAVLGLAMRRRRR